MYLGYSRLFKRLGSTKNTKKWACVYFPIIERALVWEQYRKSKQTKRKILEVQKREFFFCYVRTKLAVALVWKGQEMITEKKWPLEDLKNIEFLVKNRTNLRKKLQFGVSGPKLAKYWDVVFSTKEAFLSRSDERSALPPGPHLPRSTLLPSFPSATPPSCPCLHPLAPSLHQITPCAFPRYYAMAVCNLSSFERRSFIYWFRLALFVLLIPACAQRRSHASRTCPSTRFPLQFLTTVDVLVLRVEAILF